MATMKQHRRRSKKRNTPFDAKCVTNKYIDGKIKKVIRQQNATLKHGILLNKVDNLYYGLISRNPQFEDLNYVRSVNIIFNKFFMTHAIKKEKFIIIDNEITTNNKFYIKLNFIDYKCVNCKTAIKVDIRKLILKKDVLCENCCNKQIINKIDRSKILNGINEVYYIIKDTTTNNLKLIHEYQLRNLKKENK